MRADKTWRKLHMTTSGEADDDGLSPSCHHHHPDRSHKFSMQSLLEWKLQNVWIKCDKLWNGFVTCDANISMVYEKFIHQRSRIHFRAFKLQTGGVATCHHHIGNKFEPDAETKWTSFISEKGIIHVHSMNFCYCQGEIEEEWCIVHHCLCRFFRFDCEKWMLRYERWEMWAEKERKWKSIQQEFIYQCMRIQLPLVRRSVHTELLFMASGASDCELEILE